MPVKKVKPKIKTKTKPLNWKERYGDPKEYKQLCSNAHKSTKGECCSCMKARSKVVHHTKYGHDKIGSTVFPLCRSCHTISHNKQNWIISKSDPVWGNHSVKDWEQRLKIGFKLLSMQ